MLKAKEICTTMANDVPYGMIISYIINKGTASVKKIADKDIDNLKESPYMTKEFTARLVRAAREICNKCDQDEIIKFIQYVNAKDNTEEGNNGNIHEKGN